MNNHTIIGMAGHIDHGKTAVIKALTGIETDRRPEEQARGITIDIGFAYWKDDVTIIDVPGHEKFVRNMVAGVSTVDLFLLVIAADDGIMPQTIEHLDILKFFGVRDGVVALNKIDLVDEEWTLLITEEIENFVIRNGFNNIPVIPVSAVKNIGIEELHSSLMQKIGCKQSQRQNRPFRLNVDRCFSAKGFGSVVTGTVLSAEIKVSDGLVILPSQKETKVRCIEAHQKTVEKATAGQRAAINLANVSNDDLPRGVVLIKPNTLKPVHEILAIVQTVDHLRFKIKRHSLTHVHLGTSEILGRINWFDDGSALESIQTYHLRIRTNDPAVAAPGDAILLRSFSPVTTIAGGKVVQIAPLHVKKSGFDWQNYFHILDKGELAERIRLILRHAGFRVFNSTDFQQEFFETDDAIRMALEKLLTEKSLISFESRNALYYIDVQQMDRTQALIVKALDKELAAGQFRKGLNTNELENLTRSFHLSGVFFECAVQHALKSGELIFDGEVYSTRQAALSEKNSKIKNEIADYYRACRFNPPELSQLAVKFQLPEKSLKNITLELSKEGLLKSIDGFFYLHDAVFEELLHYLRGYFTEKANLDVTVLKNFTQSSRKWVIPLFEYLDSRKYTRRHGDERIKGENLYS